MVYNKYRGPNTSQWSIWLVGNNNEMANSIHLCGLSEGVCQRFCVDTCKCTLTLHTTNSQAHKATQTNTCTTDAAPRLSIHINIKKFHHPFLALKRTPFRALDHQGYPGDHCVLLATQRLQHSDGLCLWSRFFKNFISKNDDCIWANYQSRPVREGLSDHIITIVSQQAGMRDAHGNLGLSSVASALAAPDGAVLVSHKAFWRAFSWTKSFCLQCMHENCGCAYISLAFPPVIHVLNIKEECEILFSLACVITLWHNTLLPGLQI